MIEHLADGLTDPMQLAAAAGADLVLEVEPHLFAGQVRRQARPLGSRLRRVGCACWKCSFDPRDIAVQVFQAELQLVVVEPFRAAAKLAALELLHDQPQAFDLRLRFGESRALGR